MKKWKIIVPILLVAVLVFAFWYGGDTPGSQGWEVEKADTETPTLETPTPETPKTEKTPATEEISPEVETPAAPQEVEEPTQEQPATPEEEPQEPAQEKVEESAPVSQPVEDVPETPAEAPAPQEPQETLPEIEEETPTEPAPEGNPVPVNPEDAVISDTLLSCTLSVRCDTILNHMDWLAPGKEGLVPADGVIYGTQTVQFYEGESVFNVLLREMKRSKIHMEYENTPLYNSAYIQGINNLYEFDAGELSGWNYKVNGWFPNYGCSRYVLQDGDVVEWVYSCDLGKDIGGGNTLN